MTSVGGNRKILLYAIDGRSKLASKCICQILKLKKLQSYHIHVTASDFSEDDDFWSDLNVIKHLNTRLILHQTDVTCEESVTTTIEKVIEIGGKIDVLVCQMNDRLTYSATKQTGAFISSVYELNLYPYIRMISNTLPHMIKNNKGHIIAVNSYAGIQGLPYLSAYSSARFALEGYLQSIASEMAIHRICVSVIETALEKIDRNIMALKRSTVRGHGELSEVDRELIDRIESSLEKQDLLKSLTAEKITSCVHDLLTSVNPTLRHYANKSCRKVACNKFIDPKGIQTLAEVTKFFLNVDITDYRNTPS